MPEIQLVRIDDFSIYFQCTYNVFVMHPQYVLSLWNVLNGSTMLHTTKFI